MPIYFFVRESFVFFIVGSTLSAKSFSCCKCHNFKTHTFLGHSKKYLLWKSQKPFSLPNWVRTIFLLNIFLNDFPEPCTYFLPSRWLARIFNPLMQWLGIKHMSVELHLQQETIIQDTEQRGLRHVAFLDYSKKVVPVLGQGCKWSSCTPSQLNVHTLVKVASGPLSGVIDR